MTSDAPEPYVVQPASSAELPFAETIEALRSRGAERVDPMGIGFCETLARRALTQPPSVRQLLEQRLAKSLAALEQRLAAAEAEARDQLAGGIATFPHAAKALRKHAYNNDALGLRRLLTRLEGQGSSSPLTELLATLDLQNTSSNGSEPMAGSRQPAELKSMRVFRRTWSKLRAEQQLTNAMAQAPSQAGPLNSHALALQAIKWMRDNAPDYFEQFTSYVDGLLWLERAAVSDVSAQKSARVRGGVRKTSG